MGNVRLVLLMLRLAGIGTDDRTGTAALFGTGTGTDGWTGTAALFGTGTETDDWTGTAALFGTWTDDWTVAAATDSESDLSTLLCMYHSTSYYM